MESNSTKKINRGRKKIISGVNLIGKVGKIEYC
jgi:hypothetical protein